VAAVHADRPRQSLVDESLGRVDVGVFEGQVSDLENRVLLEVPLDLGCLVVGCPVHEEDEPLEIVPFGVGHEVGEVSPELDVPSSGKGVPHDFLAGPEEGDEAVHPLGVSQGGNIESVAPAGPAAFDPGEELDPFLVLEGDGDPFFSRAPATRLYLRTSSRLR